MCCRAGTHSLSPAYNKDDPSALYSWVGIIMYLPTDEEQQRAAITRQFDAYRSVVADIGAKYNVYPHWAKIEVPGDDASREKLRSHLRKRYDLDTFSAARAVLDPKGVMSNGITDALFHLNSGA